jgi:hypothetical protein
MKKLLDFLSRIFFVGKHAPAAEPKFWVAIIWAILLFLATRTAVLILFAARHYDILTADPGDYVAIADFILQHGRLPNSEWIENRQFPGLAILIALVTPLVGNTIAAGFLVSWLSSIGSLITFHALFRNVRLTLFYVVFVPSWVASSTLIMSEGLTLLLMLTAIWALHRESSFHRRLFLLFIAGFILIVRNTAVFFMVAFLTVWWWEQERERYGWMRLLAYGLATAALPLAYLAWNWITLGELFPQLRSQLAYFVLANDGGYPKHLLTWPGQALIHGLGLGEIPLAKKLSVICSLFLCVGIILRYYFCAAGTVARDLARPFAVASLAHLLFHLCIGGSFGFSSFDRYASHINPLLAKGVTGERQLRWFWIAVATLIGILFAGFTGYSPGAVSILPLLKSE